MQAMERYMKPWFLSFLSILLLVLPAQAEMPIVGFITGASGLGDLSFNDMGYGGIRKAQQEFGFKLIVLEPKGNGESTEQDVLKLVAKADIIILLGVQHTELAKQAAQDNPHKKFVLVEMPVRDMANMSSIMFKQHEGSFLAGAMAGYMTQTGTVGFIGGTKVLPVEAFEQGYREGFLYARPDGTLRVEYLSAAGDFSGFSNPAKAYGIAMGQYEQGADIVFGVAGLSGNGVIEAARRTGKLAIGVDSDQDSLAKGFVLTSMIKRLDTALYHELQVIMGGHFSPGITFYGLGNGGVSLSQMKYTRHLINPEILEKIKAIRKEIINGGIKVTDLLPKG